MSMFDFNGFKKSVKEWIRLHPNGTSNDLRDFCEEAIPPQHFAANEWIIDQTLSWYSHILSSRDTKKEFGEEEVD